MERPSPYFYSFQSENDGFSNLSVNLDGSPKSNHLAYLNLTSLVSSNRLAHTTKAREDRHTESIGHTISVPAENRR
jgi:hypothetical protein